MKKVMEQPKALGLEAVACIANIAAATAVFGSSAGEIVAIGAACNLPALAGAGVTTIVA